MITWTRSLPDTPRVGDLLRYGDPRRPVVYLIRCVYPRTGNEPVYVDLMPARFGASLCAYYRYDYFHELTNAQYGRELESVCYCPKETET